MQIRRLSLHLVLSFLLLWSQQIGFAHSVTHRVLPGAATLQDDGGKPGKQAALEQFCDQCLSVAQVATAIGGKPFTFFPVAATYPAVIACTVISFCVPVVTAFQSRAPPV